MSRRITVAVRLVLTIQSRAKFPHVYFGMTVFTVIVFRTLVPDELIPMVLPALLFGEPGSLGVLMVAAHRYLERGERSVVALLVTPLSSGEYVSALILGSAVLPTIAAALIQAGVQGFDGRVLLIVPPLYLIAVISGSIGLVLSTMFRDFTRFLVGSIPAIMIYSLPLLAFFELAPWWAFKWIPSDPALVVFGMLSHDAVSVPAYAGSVGLLGVFAAAAWWGAIATYSSRVRGELEFA